MAAGRIVVAPYMPVRDRNGEPVPGAKLYVFVNETTTLATIYTDFGLTVPSNNPVQANSSGQFPSVFAEAGTEIDPVVYSIQITSADGSLPGDPATFDNYRPSVDYDTAAVFLAEQYALQAENAAAAAAALVGASGTVVTAYGADSTGVKDSSAAILAALVEAKQSSGILTFPPGEYLAGSISSYFLDQDDLLVQGTPGKTVIRWAAPVTSFTRSPFVVTGARCKIDGITFRYGSGKHYAVLVKGAADFQFSNNKTQGRMAGVYFEALSSNGVVENNEFLGTDDQAINAVGTGGYLLTDNKAPGVVSGLIVRNNYFYGFGTEPVDFNWHTHNSSIEDNYFDNPSLGGIQECIDIGGAGLNTATVVAGGTGYVTGDVITVVGGVLAASYGTFTVTASGGVVTSLTRLDSGYYYKLPGTGTLTTTGGSGTGLTVTVTTTFCRNIKVTGNIIVCPTGSTTRLVRIKADTRDFLVANNMISRAETPTTALNNEDGVYVEYSHDGIVSGNVIKRCQRGVTVASSYNVGVFDNTITWPRRDAVLVTSALSLDVTVSRNQIDMTNTEAVESAISIESSASRVLVSDNTIVGSSVINGASVTALSTDISIANNDIKGCTYGVIAVATAARIRVESNDISGYQQDGVNLNGCSWSRVADNRMQDGTIANVSGCGIRITSSDYVVVNGNQITDTRSGGARTQARGIRFVTAGDRCVVTGNIIGNVVGPTLDTTVLTNSQIANNISA